MRPHNRHDRNWTKRNCDSPVVVPKLFVVMPDIVKLQWCREEDVSPNMGYCTHIIVFHSSELTCIWMTRLYKRPLKWDSGLLWLWKFESFPRNSLTNWISFFLLFSLSILSINSVKTQRKGVWGRVYVPLEMNLM